MNTLKTKIIYKGEIILKTGLHIGGSNSAMNIGGPDKFVVRNPIDSKPYIPGSSLKGKLRSLIELNDGHVDVDTTKFPYKYGPTKDSSTPAGMLFGTIEDKKGKTPQQPSRLIVRDSQLISAQDVFRNTDLLYTESKTEVCIDRITAIANPRTFERVPAGAVFALEMVLNIFDTDDENLLKLTLERAIKLIQDDYLGGHGSRGYGQIEIKILERIPRDKSFYEANAQ